MKPTANRLQRAIHLVKRTEDAILALLLTGMILLAAAQIFSRNLFSVGLTWGEPLLRVLVLWLTLLGAMAATRERHHIHIDALSRFLPDWGNRAAQRLTDLFSALVCAMLAWHAGRFVHAEWLDGMEIYAGVPSWIAELIMPLGFGVMALRFLLQAVSAAPVRRSRP